MNDLDISFNTEGELVISREKGDRLVLTKDVLESIWRETEFRKTMEYLENCEAVKEDKSLLQDIEKLTEYYIAERDNFVVLSESILLRLSITDVDMDLLESEEEEYEEPIEDYSFILK